MTLSAQMDHTEATQHAGQAERGHLRSLGALLRAMVGGEVVGVPVPRQTITAAGEIDLEAEYIDITGPGSGTYAVTLAAPPRPGMRKVIEMTSTTSTNSVTLALTNVAGGSAGTTATFNAAGETLVLVSAGSKWLVLAEVGVTLS